MLRRLLSCRFFSRKILISLAFILGAISTLLLLFHDLGFDLGGQSVKKLIEGAYIHSNVSSTDLKDPNYEKGNDVILTLVRNSELDQMISTITQFEERFNSKFHYDWYFMNDQPFTDEFLSKVGPLVSGKTKFITIPKEFWSYPKFIDQNKVEKVRQEYGGKEIMYGSSESYRFMCRFNSGFFFKLPELLDIEFYWRIEPGVNFKCDITYDVFRYMREHDKVYGFNMALGEDVRTIPSLWNVTSTFFQENPQYLADENDIAFVSDDDGATYNLCHFWSNFEIANMEFFRGKAYQEYFEHLEKAGGFFYERWGDAPVHTLAVSLMLRPDQVHFVANTGYYHNPNQDCPKDDALRGALSCDCNPQKDFTWHRWSCVPKFFDVNDYKRPNSLSNLKLYYTDIYDTMPTF